MEGRHLGLPEDDKAKYKHIRIDRKIVNLLS
jgi:hypothetical protein